MQTKGWVQWHRHERGNQLGRNEQKSVILCMLLAHACPTGLNSELLETQEAAFHYGHKEFTGCRRGGNIGRSMTHRLAQRMDGWMENDDAQDGVEGGWMYGWIDNGEDA
eukprot:1160625-Pelagomonas_calceolata.AAC.7